MNTKTFIDLAQLVQDISKVVLKSAFVIKEISQNLSEVFYKDDQYDPVTEADYLVQRTITNFLIPKYPGIKIVGEENIEADDEICKIIAKKAEEMNFTKIDANQMM